MFRVIRHIEHLGSAFPQFGHTLHYKKSRLEFETVGADGMFTHPFRLAADNIHGLVAKVAPDHNLPRLPLFPLAFPTSKSSLDYLPSFDIELTPVVKELPSVQQVLVGFHPSIHY